MTNSISEPEVEKDEPFDEQERQLCADGACTGVIGENGVCKVCGRPAGDPAQPGEPLRFADSEKAEPDFKADRGDHVFDDDDRRLCADGACIGVLNSQGICKVCGKSASS